MPKIAIIGAGIAGLAIARALSLRGLKATVYEQRASLSEEGYGIQLSPNALTCLHLLDLKIEGIEPKNLIVKSGDKHLTTMSMVGFLTTKRETLHKALREGLVDIHLNSRIETIDADLVIVADGINSAFRKDPIDDSGLVSWRKITMGQQDNVEMSLKSGFHHVSYPLSNTQINHVISLKKGQPPSEAGYKPYPLFTRPFKGGEGVMTLIGDAAHAMLPNLAQGAAMALEDAVVLAKMLDMNNIEASLRAFEQTRKPRVTRIAREAYLNSKIYQMSKPFSYARDMAIRHMPLRAKYDWIYEFKIDDLLCAL